MAKINNQKQESEEKNLLKLVKFNPDIMERCNKSPQILIDDYVGVFVDEYSWELVKVKQITVTEDNIKSTSNTYGDKYKTGDTYQEWISMNKYLSTFENAVKCYVDLKFKHECSQLSYCKNISELVKIKKDIFATINKFLETKTIPTTARDVQFIFEDIKNVKNDISELRTIVDETVQTCDNLIQSVSEKRAKMIAKGIITEKEIKHRIKKED